MALAPGLDAADFGRSSKVIAVAIFAQPFALAVCLAGLAASGLETIALAVLSSRVGNEELGATAAFASGLRVDHAAHQLAAARSGRKRKKKTGKKMKSKKEEELSERSAGRKSSGRRRIFKPACFRHFHSAADSC
jgi:hypothetical protein